MLASEHDLLPLSNDKCAALGLLSAELTKAEVKRMVDQIQRIRTRSRTTLDVAKLTYTLAQQAHSNLNHDKANVRTAFNDKNDCSVPAALCAMSGKAHLQARSAQLQAH